MSSHRWAWVEIDYAALRNNVVEIARHVAPQQVWAVVKANAYGHGAVQCAQVALQSGASGLCVALAEEGFVLRQAGIRVPILVMSEQPPELHREMISHGLTATLYNRETIEQFAQQALDLQVMAAVHLKVDTGMHRVGVRMHDALEAAQAIVQSTWLTLDGVYTHLATADMADTSSSQQQIDVFVAVVNQLHEAGIQPAHVHASNSASAIRGLDDATHCTMVRVGIAMFGIAGDAEHDSFGAPHSLKLQPVLSLHARVSHVQQVPAGEGVSYGLKRREDHEVTVATIPIGYADGVPRGLWKEGTVLIGGKHRSFSGVVTMDQIMVNCENDEVRLGDEVVLLGSQDAASVSANEWAKKMATIGYEIVCGLSSRLPRKYIN